MSDSDEFKWAANHLAEALASYQRLSEEEKAKFRLLLDGEEVS